MLFPFGWLYGKIADARNTLYDKGVFNSHSLGARTISIGNITAGGTGKTPLVGLVAEILAERGETVCILSRGYGRKNPKSRVLVSDCKNVLADAGRGGDEPVELAQKLLGKAIIIADPDRVSAAGWAKENFGVTVFVLDDGFQHRRAKRDLDIVCVDATDPFGNGKMLPAGILREPLANLKRADMMILTRANLARNIENLKSQISDLHPGLQVFVSENRISAVIGLEEFHTTSQRRLKRSADDIGWESLRAEGNPKNVDNGVRITAFCALGNPDSFFGHLLETFDSELMNGFDLSLIRKFPDHHFYTQQDINGLEKQARECNIDAFITTAKDAVKLKNLKFETPCYVVTIEPCIDDVTRFRDLIISSS
ncbi:MAG: tetraacyldisaccharide 4'-kinase [Saprospiraceae bacterium]|nr:tetraacyldisaccharide 4'-kinase [Pyrinomonadaceae bacterium]